MWLVITKLNSAVIEDGGLDNVRQYNVGCTVHLRREDNVWKCVGYFVIIIGTEVLLACSALEAAMLNVLQGAGQASTVKSCPS